jgi:hypothetical protein
VVKAEAHQLIGRRQSDQVIEATEAKLLRLKRGQSGSRKREREGRIYKKSSSNSVNKTNALKAGQVAWNMQLVIDSDVR